MNKKRSGLLSGIKIIFLWRWKLPLRRMVGEAIPEVPSKGFFLKIIWSSFYPQKKATEKHRKSFDPTVDQVLLKLIIIFFFKRKLFFEWSGHHVMYMHQLVCVIYVLVELTIK